MSNNDIVIYPIDTIIINQGGGGGGPVTGSDSFFVSSLDVRGRETNSTGDLVLSASTSIITISGNLNVLGSINAPISGASTPVTGAGNFFVTNQVDVRGYLTNSLTNTVAVSGNLLVGGNLTWNSASIQTFLDGRYVTTASYGPFSASHNSFSASVNVFSASQLTLNAGLNSFSASVNAFSASQLSLNTALNLFSASINSFSASMNAFSASVKAFTASLTSSMTLAAGPSPSIPADHGVLWVTSSTGDLWFSSSSGKYALTPTGSGGGGGGSGSAIYPSVYDPSIYIFDDDFMGYNVLAYPWFQQLLNGGAITTDAAAVISHPGVATLSTGASSAAGYAEALHSLIAISPGSMAIQVEWIVSVPTLSNGTDRFNVFVGATNLASNGMPGAGLFFAYNDASGSDWKYGSAAGSALSMTDSGVTVNAGDWYRLGFTLDKAAKTGSFYINGNLVGTLYAATANLPSGSTSGNRIGVQAMVAKQVGTAARTVSLDRCYLRLSEITR